MDQSADRPKILHIDDNPESRVLVQRLLSSDYLLLEADDGLRGIELAVENRPDLVLVDLHLPDLTGYEVTTRLKSLMPETTVVALTADVAENVRERALASGCDGYLSKPLDPDDFVRRVQSFLAGERELLEDESHRQTYQEALVTRLEKKVRQLTRVLRRNVELNRRNLQLLKKAQRQALLLEAGARVGRSITSILDLDKLLSATVDVIGEEFGFYYVGVFLIDETGEWAVLRAGRGGAGEGMLAEGYRLAVGGRSLVGEATGRREPVIALGVEEGSSYPENPHLTATRSAMALPLVVGDTLLGALSVHSTAEAAFSEDDVVALQAMAEQLAIAINNARLLKDLEAAHEELMRTKTFRVIAAATGEAIHWVGNKAAPIPGSAMRVADDVVRYLAVAGALLAKAPPDLCEHKFARLLELAVEEMAERGIDLEQVQAELEAQPLDRLRRTLSVGSIFEDLEIVRDSARAILNIKEDLIGPAREPRVKSICLPHLLQETITSMGLPDGVVRMLFADDLPPVRADRVQLIRVFVNLVKNGMEAMEGVGDKKLFVWARRADDPGFVVVEVNDNGSGIPPDRLDKIWMPFYTTKGDRGGTGLGLAACAQIVDQLGGKIIVESEVGVGTTFSVFLPVEEKGYGYDGGS